LALDVQRQTTGQGREDDWDQAQPKQSPSQLQQSNFRLIVKWPFGNLFPVKTRFAFFRLEKLESTNPGLAAELARDVPTPKDFLGRRNWKTARRSWLLDA
jgi:hypothetical protein